MKCPTCWGCGQLADTKDREPWTAWLQLPVASAFAVVAGIVRPISCDACGGTGLDREDALAADTEVQLDPAAATCPVCLDRGWLHKVLHRQSAGPWQETPVVTLCHCASLSLSEATARHKTVCGCSRPWAGQDLEVLDDA